MSYVIGGQPPTTPVAERRSLVEGAWLGAWKGARFVFASAECVRPSATGVVGGLPPKN